jgi:transcriptional regulator with XRE-family HTH domain
MTSKRTRLSDEIRQAIDNYGQTRYVIAKATGIDQSTLSRFMAGKRGLPMKTLDTLADYLDLHIVTGKNRTKKG